MWSAAADVEDAGFGPFLPAQLRDTLLPYSFGPEQARQSPSLFTYGQEVSCVRLKDGQVGTRTPKGT